MGQEAIWYRCNNRCSNRLPAEASLYELHPYAKAFKEDFKAFQREDISVPEWGERKQLALFEARDKTIVSVVATRIDRGKKMKAQSFLRWSLRLESMAELLFNPLRSCHSAT